MTELFFQFWAAYVPCEAQYKDAVQITLEQIDVIIRLTNKYPNDLTICTSSKGLSSMSLLFPKKNYEKCKRVKVGLTTFSLLKS